MVIWCYIRRAKSVGACSTRYFCRSILARPRLDMLLIVGYMQSRMRAIYRLGDLFFPMWRVERISMDEAAGDALAQHNRSSVAQAAPLQNWSNVENNTKNIACCKYETLFHSRA